MHGKSTYLMFFEKTEQVNHGIFALLIMTQIGFYLGIWLKSLLEKLHILECSLDDFVERRMDMNQVRNLRHCARIACHRGHDFVNKR